MRIGAKRTIVVGVSLMVLAAALLVYRGSVPEREEPAAEVSTIRLYHQIANQTVVRALRNEIGEFQGLFPQMQVTLTTREGDWDVGIVNDYRSVPAVATPNEQSTDNQVETEADSVGPEDMVPWSGPLWVLAARNEVLDELDEQLPRETQLLTDGGLTPDGWERVLSAVHAMGHTPIAIGNSHGWPLVLWYQVWIAASLSPAAAAEFPDSMELSESPQLVRLRDDLSAWKQQGYFSEQTWNQGWADGLNLLNSDDAAFAMLSEAQLGTLNPETRQSLRYLPFPRGSSDPAWSIGSAQYLVLNPRSDVVDASRQLMDFLSSEGVTGRLAAATGRPFFSWEQGEQPVVISAWTTMANTPDFDRLVQFLSEE